MKLYIRYLSVLLKSQMQHKASFFMSLIGQGLTSLTTLIGIVFMFSRFDQVKGFTFSEVLLCFSSVLMAFSLAECFARGFDTFSKMLANGEFDRIMVRPRALMFQVLAQKADFARLGRAIEAAIVFGYAIAKCSVSWTLPKALVLAEMVLCGAAVFSGVSAPEGRRSSETTPITAPRSSAASSAQRTMRPARGRVLSAVPPEWSERFAIGLLSFYLSLEKLWKKETRGSGSL